MGRWLPWPGRHRVSMRHEARMRPANDPRAQRNVTVLRTMRREPRHHLRFHRIRLGTQVVFEGAPEARCGRRRSRLGAGEAWARPRPWGAVGPGSCRLPPADQRGQRETTTRNLVMSVSSGLGDQKHYCCGGDCCQCDRQCHCSPSVQAFTSDHGSKIYPQRPSVADASLRPGISRRHRLPFPLVPRSRTSSVQVGLPVLRKLP